MKYVDERSNTYSSVLHPILVGLAVLIIAFGNTAASQAGEKTQQDSAGPTHSVAYDLQQIAVLCATQPGSQQFEQAWSAWVAANPDADINRTIESVLSQAGTLQSLSAVARDPALKRPTRAELTEYMTLLASRAQRSRRVQTPPMPASEDSPQTLNR